MPFQFTPLREGRHSVKGRYKNKAPISIHAPPRGATESAATGSAEQEFQFTPLREGRRCGRFESRVGYCISIHAPPRGATEIAGNGWKILFISIHAPPRGATALRGHRRRKRRISIHAPPRGATPFVVFRCSMLLQFQFTPLREGRLVELSAITGLPYISIHAPPRGATIPLWTFRWGAAHFNSRPSARGDTLVEKVKELPDISIHAPPRGATSTGNPAVQCQYFNSRPSARGDSPSPAMPVKFFDFNSRPSARGDAALYVNGRKMSISIHAPPRGATSVRGRW